jgi:hypothetical protein
MDDPNLPFNLRDGLLCLVFLAGIGAGIFLIVRKQAKAGGLALAGFVLFSIDPIAEVILFRILLNFNSDNYNFLNWTYACISGLSVFLGSAALIAALIMAAWPQVAEPVPPPPTS